MCWGEIIPLVAVIIAIPTLIVLTVQSWLQYKQLKLQNYIEYTKRYQGIILNFPENVNKKDFDMEKLDDKVRDKTMRYMRAYYDLCFEEFDLKSKGYIDKKIWGTWKGGMEFAFSKTAFKKAWETIEGDTQYSEAFNDLVNGCKENTRKNI